LTANAPETKDNDFTWADFQARNNNELVAIYGNFINRVAVLTHKYYDGEVPNANNLLEIDNQTLKAVKAFPEKIGQSIEKYRFREAQQKLMELARLGNKYLADEEPWKHFKTDPVRTQNIMFVALQISAALAVLSEPFLPHTSKKLNHILSLGRLAEKLNWSNIAELEVLLPTNHTIEKADLLFSKIEDEQVQKQLDKLKQSKMDNENPTQDLTPQKEQITFEDFSKLDIRTGIITEAEKMPKTKKLMVLKVDIGLEKRTIVSGIAEYFKAEDIIGKQVSVVINLKPIKLRGTLSEGMILMTESEKGELVFVNPDENTPNGKTIA
jgi:methionyl-tRNA synthetase